MRRLHQIPAKNCIRSVLSLFLYVVNLDTMLPINIRNLVIRYIAKALADIGVPIVRTINGDGMFEGANAMWVSLPSKDSYPPQRLSLSETIVPPELRQYQIS